MVRVKIHLGGDLQDPPVLRVCGHGGFAQGVLIALLVELAQAIHRPAEAIMRVLRVVRRAQNQGPVGLERFLEVAVLLEFQGFFFRHPPPLLRFCGPRGTKGNQAEGHSNQNSYPRAHNFSSRDASQTVEQGGITLPRKGTDTPVGSLFPERKGRILKV